MNKNNKWGVITFIQIFFILFILVGFADYTLGMDQYPSKPINLIMVWPAGGGSDIALRPLVEAASKKLGQQITINYHPGGNGAVGLGILKTKPGDGYTIGMASVTVVLNPHLRKVPYNFFEDFTPIMQYTDQSAGLAVAGDSPWKTIKEFLEYAKANPGKIRFSSSGPGSLQALPVISIGEKLGIDWKHIPFEGGPPALVAVMGGHVEAYATTMHAKGQMQSGQLRLLAFFGEKRNPSFPDVPTLQEATGIHDGYSNAQFILAPKGLKTEVIETLHQAFKKAMDDPTFKEVSQRLDHVPFYLGPEETIKRLKEVDKTISKIIK